MSRRERSPPVQPRVEYRQNPDVDLDADDARRRVAAAYKIVIGAAARQPGSPPECAR